MTVAVLVCVILRNGLSPRGTPLEIDVVDVGSSINDVDIDAFAAVFGIEVLVEVTEA